MLQFSKYAEVLTVDGEQVGKVDRVVIDPTSHQASHIIVNRVCSFPKTG